MDVVGGSAAAKAAQHTSATTEIATSSAARVLMRVLLRSWETANTGAPRARLQRRNYRAGCTTSQRKERNAGLRYGRNGVNGVVQRFPVFLPTVVSNKIGASPNVPPNRPFVNR